MLGSITQDCAISINLMYVNVRFFFCGRVKHLKRVVVVFQFS